MILTAVLAYYTYRTLVARSARLEGGMPCDRGCSSRAQYTVGASSVTNIIVPYGCFYKLSPLLFAGVPMIRVLLLGVFIGVLLFESSHI